MAKININSLKILALDTSTDACSAALLSHGEVIARHEIAPRRHNELILPILKTLLAEAELALNQLDAIAFGCGPGSFTGLRIAASITQSIAYASNLPVIAVSTLRALAQGAYREFAAEYVLASLDAHMQEIYWGVYQLNPEHLIMMTETPELVCAPEQIPPCPLAKNWLGIGNGWDSYAALLQKKIGPQLQKWIPNRYPNAHDIALLAAHDYQQGKAISAEQALPVYLRDKVVR